jgi:alkaline phosphatase D
MQPIFQHGVASGDPLQDRVILWTRLTLHELQDQPISWEIAADRDFRYIIDSGSALACAEDDHTVHVDAANLQPGHRYYFRFHALGQTSPTGHTKTLPLSNASHARFAQASCAKYNAGYFNAYARIADRAERGELDFLLHLGDYIYEMANAPGPGQTPGADVGRPFDPLYECKTLQDYRTRYSQAHRDPDAQRMHASLPILPTVDDHEFADGAWRGGADLHDETRDGPWAERVRDCLRARYEWLPIRLPDPKDPLRVYRAVHLGTLMDLFLINTRIHRDQPVAPPHMHDPDRSELGLDQRDWLFDEFDHSGATWRLLANSSVLGTTWKPDLPESARLPLLKAKLIAADGLGPDYDQWDGYPAERYLLLRHMRDHKLGNFVVLSGGIHVALAQELKMDPFDPASKSIAIECVNSSISSQNFDDKMRWKPRTKSIEYEQELLREFPEMKYIDLDSHGYNIVDVTPERVQVEWWSVDGVLKRSKKESRGAVFQIPNGRPVLIPLGA